MKIRIEEKSNYKSVWIDGKTIRFAIDPLLPIKELEYPEFYDIKITGRCSFGRCNYCYMDSKEDSSHYKNAVEKLKSFFSNMNENQRPWQIACLESDTFVFTKNGVVPIKDLKIGDFVYNEIGGLSEIKKILKNEKNTIKLIGNKGFEVVCTPDHLFLSEGKLIMAKDTLHKKLDCSDYNLTNNINKIDLSEFINKSSRQPNKRGGSSGGSYTMDYVRFMHTLPFINRYIDIDDDVMWLYGISVAEGSKRGLSLNVNEIEYAERASAIYKKITNLNSNIYPNKENGLIVLFDKSKIYRTIFFEAMGIGYGARNKSIKFLYNLDNKLILSALRGMFDGDGCYRKKYDKRIKRYTFSLSYKTTSRKLANELVHLLSTRFGIKSSIYHGISPDRYMKKRFIKSSDYYNVNIYNKDDIIKLFPDVFKDEDFDRVYKSIYSHKKNIANYIFVKSVEDSGYKEVYDISLDDSSSHLFTISHGVITHNCGGGEPTEHPEFLDILKFTFDLGITPNYTTNGSFILSERRSDIIEYTKKYCGGVAVSCHQHLKEMWSEAANILIENKIMTNFHIIISDKNSIDRFADIYENWKNKIDYFVLLPQINKGRSKDALVDWGYLKSKLPANKNQIAFGANFYPYLKDDNVGCDLYEPEIMSKFLDLKDMKLYGSSFEI